MPRGQHRRGQFADGGAGHDANSTKAGYVEQAGHTRIGADDGSPVWRKRSQARPALPERQIAKAGRMTCQLVRQQFCGSRIG